MSWCVGFGLLIGAFGLLLTLPALGQATIPSPWWSLAVIAVGFAVAEFSVFRFLFRREAIAFSLSEIPLAFCFRLPRSGPGTAGPGDRQPVGDPADHADHRRTSSHSISARSSFEMALAFVVFRGVVDGWGSGDTSATSSPPSLATGISGIVSSILVSVAISQFEGDLWRRIAHANSGWPGGSSS